jgi:molybdopterin converting factor small subunit
VGKTYGKPRPAEADLAKVNINFIGLWRLILGLRSVTVEVNTVGNARDYVEMTYGPLYWKWLRFKGRHDRHSVWESSNILLNGRGLMSSEETRLKDGDNLDLLPRVAGG